jgi:predicted DNA-binding protein (MmcQ/YjbR family)
MSIEDLQQICEPLKGVTQDIKWENHLCFNIGGKMFLVTSPDSIPHSASFKVTDHDFYELCAKEGFIPAPYLARYKWVHLDDINRLSRKDWEKFIRQSYELIYSKLPTGTKKQIATDKNASH